MIRERIQGIVKLDEIVTELKNDREYYHIEYVKLVRGFDVVGRLKNTVRKNSDHEYVYKEQDNLGDKFRGFIFIPVGFEYYAKLKYII